MTACAACGRTIPAQYAPRLTAAGPMHPGCWRKSTGRPPVNDRVGP